MKRRREETETDTTSGGSSSSTTDSTSSSSDSSSSSSSSEEDKKKKKKAQPKKSGYVPKTHLPKKRVKFRRAERTDEALAAPGNLLNKSPDHQKGVSPLEREIAPLYFGVDVTLNGTTHTIPPLQRKLAGMEKGTPPVQLLSTGMPFINSMEWHPSKFKSDKGVFRILLVAGTRMPRSYTWRLQGGESKWAVDEPEANKEEVEKFSRTLQGWRVGVPPGPKSKAELKPTDEDGAVNGPSTFELTLPGVEDVWGVTDVKWYGTDEESLSAMMAMGGFHHCEPTSDRLGYVAVSTTKGYVAVYRIPVFSEVPQHFVLTPLAVGVVPGGILTAVTWQLRKGSVKILAGMSTGDVALLHLVKSGEELKLLVSKHLRTSSLCVIKQLTTNPAWLGRLEHGIDVATSDSCPDQADMQQPLHWQQQQATTTVPPRGPIPCVPNITDRDLIFSVGKGERGITQWDVDLLDSTTGHSGSLQVKCRFPVSCVHPLPYSTLLVGMEDGTVHVQPPTCDFSFPLWHLRSSVEVHNSVTSLSHTTCGRRVPEKNLKSHIRSEGKRPPRVDYLIGTATIMGRFSVLRVPKRVLTVDQGARKCKICRGDGVKNSWMLGSCNCIPQHSVVSTVEDTPILLVKEVKWEMPKVLTDTPKVSIDLAVYPTPGMETEHRDATAVVGNITRMHNHLTAFAAGGEKRSHLLATSSQGGLVSVVPI